MVAAVFCCDVELFAAFLDLVKLPSTPFTVESAHSHHPSLGSGRGRWVTYFDGITESKR